MDMVGSCLGRGHVRTMLWICLGHVVICCDMLWTCYAQVGDMLGTSCGHIVDMLGPCWGHVWNIL